MRLARPILALLLTAGSAPEVLVLGAVAGSLAETAWAAAHLAAGGGSPFALDRPWAPHAAEAARGFGKLLLSSIVVSVNRFLAPYERIVDFAVIDRDLDPAVAVFRPRVVPFVAVEAVRRAAGVEVRRAVGDFGLPLNSFFSSSLRLISWSPIWS